MRKRMIAPAAIVALKQALTDIYWYKADLGSFLSSTLSNPAILGRVNWYDYKRNIVAFTIDFLAQNEDEYQPDLVRLISEVARVDDFSHLARLEDGEIKVKQAKASVAALRNLTAAHEALYENQKKAEERRQAAHRRFVKTIAVQQKLSGLNQEYYQRLK
jgi:hypothetical protein